MLLFLIDTAHTQKKTIQRMKAAVDMIDAVTLIVKVFPNYKMLDMAISSEHCQRGKSQSEERIAMK